MKTQFFHAALALLLLTASAVSASEGKAKAVGTVVSVSGKVTLISQAGNEGSLKLGQPLFAGDRVKTGANGRIQAVLSDGTQLKVNYLTDFTLRDTDSKGKASDRGIGSIKIALGELWAKVTKKNSKLEFETPGAVAAVKGTNPYFSVDSNGDLCVSLFEGGMVMDSGGCTQAIAGDQMMCLKQGQKACEAKITPIKGKKTFADEFAGPSSADVTLKVRDKDNKVREVKVRYSK